MARRSDHTRDEIKVMSIQAGRDIIRADGFSSFSARKIAKKIGYSVGTLYNVFKSHEDLVFHISAATLDEMYEFITKRAKKTHHGVESLIELAECYIEFANNNYNNWSALFEFNLPQNIALPEWYTDKIKKLFILADTPLKSLIGNNTKLVKRAGKVLWAAIHGICQLGITGKLDIVGADSIKVLTNSLIKNYIQGIKL